MRPGLRGVREVFISVVYILLQALQDHISQFLVRAPGWITSTQEPVPGPHNPKNSPQEPKESTEPHKKIKIKWKRAKTADGSKKATEGTADTSSTPFSPWRAAQCSSGRRGALCACPPDPPLSPN